MDLLRPLKSIACYEVERVSRRRVRESMIPQYLPIGFLGLVLMCDDYIRSVFGMDKYSAIPRSERKDVLDSLIRQIKKNSQSSHFAEDLDLGEQMTDAVTTGSDDTIIIDRLFASNTC